MYSSLGLQELLLNERDQDVALEVGVLAPPPLMQAPPILSALFLLPFSSTTIEKRMNIFVVFTATFCQSFQRLGK